MLRPTADSIFEALRAFICDQGYPCMFARSVLRNDQLVVCHYRSLTNSAVAEKLSCDLGRFARAPQPRHGFRSFAAAFCEECPTSETDFERLLWDLLDRLHRYDEAAWSPTVSSDPDHPEFGFSFAGRAFFIIGMHPRASRPARRFAWPMVVFNLHSQFESLRNEGHYAEIRQMIRKRDEAFAGTANPMLEDFGQRSEARQYAGRAVGSDWRCPFKSPSLAASYVLPLKASRPQDAVLTQYIQRLADLVDDVIVVDGSLPAIYDRHAAAWAPFVRHIRPDEETPMGKVGGVLTGLRHARHERVVLADDDVRYDADALHRVLALLEEADVVRPQNYFEPCPWHARWDTGRALLNRLCGGDWPGTLAVRRSALEATGGYRGDVMFENLELVRTVRAAGGREAVPLDLFVARRPPSTQHFLSQRVRQAYDEWARPLRFATQLAVLPLAAALMARGRWKTLAGGVAAVAVAAEAGRRRGQGQKVFAPTAALWAPLWVAERSVTSWLALGTRLARDGIAYGSGRIREAATPLRILKRHHAGRIRSVPASHSAACPVHASHSRRDRPLPQSAPEAPAFLPLND